MNVTGALYIKRNELTFEQLEEARLQLRVINPEFQQKSRFGSRFSKASMPDKWLHFLEKTSFKASSREEEEFRIPRNYKFKSGKPHILYSTITNKITNSIMFAGSLRKYQEEFFGSNPDLLVDTDKILVVPCGHGKTVMALYLTAEYKEKTLIMVPTTFLRDQWKKSSELFLKGADVRVGESKQKTLDFKGADVYIITLDLLASRYNDLLKDGFFDYWGHNILDEAHTLGAQTYHPYISELKGRYRTALSATFRRNDGMHIILGYHFGEQYEMPLQFPKARMHKVETGLKVGALAKLNPTQIKAMIEFMEGVESPFDINGDTFHFHDADNIESYIIVADKEPSFSATKRAAIKSSMKKLLGFVNKPNYPLYDSYICEDTHRYRMTLSLLKKLRGNKRCVLVLSKRKEILKRLDAGLKSGGIKTQLIISDTNVAGLGESEYVQKEADVILGIMQLAKEGMDIERLDTLVLLNPIKDTEQAIGRILRYMEGKPTPKVYYLCEDHQISKGIFTAGIKFMGNNAVIDEAYTIKELITELDETEAK